MKDEAEEWVVARKTYYATARESKDKACAAVVSTECAALMFVETVAAEQQVTYLAAPHAYSLNFGVAAFVVRWAHHSHLPPSCRWVFEYG